MGKGGMELCTIVILLVTVAFLAWGFVNIFKQPDKDGHEEKNENKQGKKITMAVISRQLRGFALILLANIIFVFGVASCMGIFGGKRRR
jgi:hypothetical protein